MSTPTQRARQSLLRPKRQVPGQPELVIQWELFKDVIDDLGPLLTKHWREVEVEQERVPLDPDWERYYYFEASGWLRVLTVRDGKRLAGYVILLVLPHMHHMQSIFATSDIFWLDPLNRFGHAASAMFRYMEEGLKSEGVHVVNLDIKVHFKPGRGRYTVGKLLERLGYKPVQVTYSKWIGS